jgi:NAD(P)-dependent dehydrogenase (short-subunit alcohol dehydrogenase family)
MVTGGSRGIGAAVAARLAREGARIAVCYNSNPHGADQVVEQILGSGGEAFALPLNLADRHSIEQAVDRCVQRFGACDVLVNNAGMVTLGTAMATSDEQLGELMKVNLHGPLAAAQLAAPHMIAHRSGRIINISSIGSLGTAINSVAGYAMTKAALNMMTKRLAAELGEFGITVNAVSPGMITTDLSETTHSDPQFRATLDNPAATTLLRRNGRPEDIAGVVAFLAGPDAAFITAQVLTVDGGRKDFLSRSG